MEITLNGLNINDNTNYFSDWASEDPFDVKYNVVDNNFFNNPYVSSYRQAVKTIKINGVVKGSTSTVLGEKILNLKNKVIGYYKSISITTREATYTGLYTCSGLKFDSNFYNLTFIKYEAEIIIVTPLEGSTDFTTTFTTTSTATSGLPLEINTGGFAYPYITFALTASTGFSKLEILFRDSTAQPYNLGDYGFSLYPGDIPIADGDSLVISGKDKSIKHYNPTFNTYVDYYGEIPLVPPGNTTSIFVIPTCSTINYTLTCVFKNTLN